MNKKGKWEKEAKTAKMYSGLYNEIARIAHIRFINGLDKKYSPIRVQKKMLKHPLWTQQKKDLEVAEFIDDDLGQFTTFNIFTFIVVAFLAVLFFGGLIYAQGIIYNVMHDVGVANEVNAGNPGYANMSYAAEVTFGTLNQSIQALRLVALVMVLGLGVVIMVTNALVKIHPLWFFGYIIICGLAVIFSAPISNAYYTLLHSNIYDGGLAAFTGVNFVLLNLPIVVMVISVLGGVFLFINILRQDYGSGGLG